MSTRQYEKPAAKYSKKNQKPEVKSEYLSKDILDKDFLKVYLSFLKVQWFLGISRVDARDGFVSAPTCWQKLYTVVHTSLAVLVFTASYYLYGITFYPQDQIFWLGVFAYFVSVINYISCVIYARCRNNKRNVKLYLKMHEIDRLMGIKQIRVVNNIHRKLYNFTLTCIIISYSGLLILSFLGGPLLSIAYVGLAWVYSAIVFEITSTANMTVYFMLRLRFINSILLNHIEGDIVKPQSDLVRAFATTRELRRAVAQSHDFRTTDVDVYLKQLFECFTVFQDLNSFPVAVHFTIAFVIILVWVEFAVFGLLNNSFSYLEWAIILILLTMCLAQSLLLGIRFEVFFRSIKDTKRLSVVIMSRYSDGPLRDKGKRMFNLIEQTPPRFSVYDMWHMDAFFLINSLIVLSTTIVTVLQFSLP